MDGSQPVVVVTPRTFANLDFNELIRPTLSALADEDCLVSVAAGRPDVEEILAPSNARVEAFIPFDMLLPKAHLLITNGGHGAVQQGLSLGRPLIVA
jgi:UDP:flavonoid glycosyltransferase YjiC (YdhE family)